MEEKNRFSRLLEQLMQTADIKNYTLAQELQYDVSYISKWINGRIIPAEKVENKVLTGISHCIAYSSKAENQETLMQDYQVDSLEDLQLAIYDNLQAEYLYVKDLQKNTGATIAPKTAYFAELSLPQYISKMHHPVLRRVKSLDVMSAMDVMSMDHEYRLQIVQVQDSHAPASQLYSNVHFSMLIDMETCTPDYVYDSIFLLSLMSNVHVNFRLYSSADARGKAIFCVKNDFAISGMLASPNRCISVAVTEETENCNILYRSIDEMCTREALLFRRMSMEDALLSHDYARALVAPNPRWLIGHMTEHFMPDDLFEELLSHIPDTANAKSHVDELRKTHRLTQSLLEKSPIQLMFYASAFSDFAVSDEMDFFDHRIHLSASQRLRYATHMLHLLEKHENLEIHLIKGKFVPDFQYISSQCLFLSDTMSYLRFDNNLQTGLLIVNQENVNQLFSKFYHEIWNNWENIVISDRSEIFSYLHHVVQTLRLMSTSESD